MRTRQLLGFGVSVAAIMAIAFVASAQLAGPHNEIGDAGSNRNSAQVSSSGGGIAGGLGGASPGGDFEDCYIINITDPVIFQAQTDLDSEFDTQLWLFELDPDDPNAAFGLLANDEIPDGPPGPSFLPNQSDDGTNVMIEDPGCYMLCISAFNNDPVSGGGPIFNQALRTEVSGPDGPGGNNPHLDWSQDVGEGQYFIGMQGAGDARELCGTQSIPATSDTALGVLAILVALVGAVLVRRRFAQPIRAD